ncbi:hypothetical protein [Cellulomonas hominis]|uniref:hypothetical protein n=1 Tax=Cellulomonas hominis TaxID=156981 RepID=UPI001BA04371|nr:hypothetical protein [Cellulomonas hominis]VTR76371.1 hypothetical protein CHMI_01131 [Cellulomonas hominis]
MTRSRGADVTALRHACRAARVVGCAVASVLVVAFVVGLEDASTLGRLPLEGWALATASAVLLVGSLRLGMRFDERRLLVRSWWRDVSVDLAAITSVDAVPYAGWVTEGSPSRFVFVLSVTADGRRRDLSCTAASRRTAELRARLLAQHLSLTARDDA